MGLLSFLGLDRTANLLEAAAVSAPTSSTALVTMASPWQGPSHLQPAFVGEDIWGLDDSPVNRSTALKVPAVAKARDLIVETVGRMSLKFFKDGTEQAPPSWATRTNSQVSPRIRMVWTLDDLLFEGWSLWATERGSENQILDAVRVPLDHWRFNVKGQVEVNTNGTWALADSNDVILFQSTRDAFLEIGANTVRAYRDLETAWHSRTANPAPTTVITPPADAEPDEDEMRDIKDTYIRERLRPGGPVAIMPPGWGLDLKQADGLDLFEEGRNAAVLEVSRFTGVPAALLDASNTNASSVTYANTATERSWFVDYCLRAWALGIEERLSMDDVVPRGWSCQFDFSDLTTIPDPGTNEPEED